MVQKMRSDGTPYNILELNLKRLGLTMLLFSIYDLLAALVMLVWPSLVQAGAVGSFLPLVHLIMPCFCVLAWMDPKRNIVIVTGAVMARAIYGLWLLGWFFLFGQVWWFAVLGGISLVFALTHYILLRLSDFGFWEVLRRAGNPPGISSARRKSPGA